MGLFCVHCGLRSRWARLGLVSDWLGRQGAHPRLLTLRGPVTALLRGGLTGLAPDGGRRWNVGLDFVLLPSQRSIGAVQVQQ